MTPISTPTIQRASHPNTAAPHVTVHFDIDADASREDIQALVAQSQKRSAVYDMVIDPSRVAVEVG